MTRYFFEGWGHMCCVWPKYWVHFMEKKNEKKRRNPQGRSASPHFNPRVMWDRLYESKKFYKLKISAHPTKKYGLCRLTRQIWPMLSSLPRWHNSSLHLEVMFYQSATHAPSLISPNAYWQTERLINVLTFIIESIHKLVFILSFCD